MDLETYKIFLIKHGVSLASEGVNDIGLQPADALQAIGFIKHIGLPILGGEVWKSVGSRFICKDDIWDLDRCDFSTQDEFKRSTWTIAENQAKKYLTSDCSVLMVLSL